MKRTEIPNDPEIIKQALKIEALEEGLSKEVEKLFIMIREFQDRCEHVWRPERFFFESFKRDFLEKDVCEKCLATRDRQSPI